MNRELYWTVVDSEIGGLDIWRNETVPYSNVIGVLIINCKKSFSLNVRMCVGYS